ncbi:unnamed protein product [Durusdinium trenchii]|uniref:Uncharacterized protein n=1 Tax=Durusdinium trenchii TaxID=1381693 RepID=A0ABP0MA39_9DINO
MLPARVGPRDNWRHTGNPYYPVHGSQQVAPAGSPNGLALQGNELAKQSMRPPPSWKEQAYMPGPGLLDLGAQEDDEVTRKLQEAVKAAAVQYGRQAVHKGAQLAKKAAIHIYLHAESSAWTVKGVAFVVSLVLFVVSMLSLFNVFHALSHPLYYLLNSYNLAFACVIVIMEGPTEMDCQCGAWDKLQRVLFSWAAFLASRTGRALFYFFVGTLNMFMMPHDWLWTLIYFSLGSALAFVGLLSLLDRYGCTTICCPGMRGHVRGKLRDTDHYGDAIANRGSPQGSDNSSPQGYAARNPPRIQEMEQLLDAEMGHNPYPHR